MHLETLFKKKSHRILKERAKRHGRSLNKEVLRYLSWKNVLQACRFLHEVNFVWMYRIHRIIPDNSV